MGCGDPTISMKCWAKLKRERIQRHGFELVDVVSCGSCCCCDCRCAVLEPPFVEERRKRGRETGGVLNATASSMPSSCSGYSCNHAGTIHASCIVLGRSPSPPRPPSTCRDCNCRRPVLQLSRWILRFDSRSPLCRTLSCAFRRCSRFGSVR